jgi:hypothetical protein
MTLIRTSLDPFRLSLLAALGLLACVPGKGETDSASESDGTTAATTDDPTGSSSATTSASGTTTTVGTDSSTATGTTGTTTAGTTTANPTSATSTTDATSSTTDPTATTGEPVVCQGTQTDIMQKNVDPPTTSGFVQCDGGIIHRPVPLECMAPQNPSTCPADASDMGGCKTDADCTDKPFGSCQIDMVFGGVNPAPTDTCSCVYGCQTDSDCADGEVCRCAGDGLGLYTECVSSTCKSDAECPGFLCGFAPDICEPGVFSSHCTTPNDVCAGDSDCQSPPCTFDDLGEKWDCANAACGRPLLVDGEAVTAEPECRDDWRATILAPSAPAELRPRLAAYWTRIGLCEHASVASFARFILQLLAVGATPELVLAAQQALADEVEHARLCFSLASLYEGTGVGPGPLPAAPLGAFDLEAVTAAVIREACVGETLSALEAREAAARAEDPALRRVLATIAADEQRHAELGWRTVQWALARMSDDARARMHAEFAAAIEGAEATVERLSQEPASPELRAHGVVDAPLRAALWAGGLRELVRPTVDALRAAA